MKVETVTRSTRTSGSSVVVPFVDLWRAHEPIIREIEEVINDTIRRSAFTLSDFLACFETAFADYCGSKYAVGVSSGTDALHLALLACGIEPGDEVITVPNTFIATAEAISMCGATPVFVDVEESTLNMDAAKLEAAITDKTTAIIPVHLFGQTADMDSINEIAGRYGLTVVEDACQAHGAEYKGRRAGALSRTGCFSFYPGKNLGAMGDGGIVVTDDPEIAETMRTLRHHGQSGKNLHSLIGYCDRLDGLQAAILGVKLPWLDVWNNQRIDAAGHYRSVFADADIILPVPKEGNKQVFHLYVPRSKNRDRLAKYLLDQGIQTGVHYPIPIHLQPAYKHLGYACGDFPVAEKAADEIISLPMFPGITKEEIETVGNAVKRFAS